MTTLHAAGGGLPLAVHIPHVVEQVGSLAGFAAVIGLAVLSALYFSQARDLRRLREWAGRAPERAAETGPTPGSPIPGRVVAVPQQQQQRPATPAAQAAAAQPKPASTNGDASPSVTAAEGTKVGVAGEAAMEEGDAADAKPGEGGDAKSADVATPGADSKPGDAASTPPAAPGEAAAAPKPGIPGPASAAAAGAAAGAASAAASAGAGSASVAGPAAPAAAKG